MSKSYSSREILAILQRIDAGKRIFEKDKKALSEQTEFSSYGIPITSLPESVSQLVNLQTLDLHDSKITALPESLGHLANLKKLLLDDTQITSLPESVGYLANLQYLDLHRTQITALPATIGLLSNLKAMNLSYTRITALPESVGHLSNLEILNLSHTRIATLPKSIGMLANLKAIDLSYTRITALPEFLSQLANLEELLLGNTQITDLPESVGYLANLKTLNLSNSWITNLPESIGFLTNLQTLNLNKTQITDLPESIGQLAGLYGLDLSNTRITAVPESIGQLAELYRLDLSNTRITALPESIGQLSSLRFLFLKRTDITALPESVGQLCGLREIGLGGTKISELPGFLRGFGFLHALYIWGTKITVLPEWIGELSSLRYLDLEGLTLSGIPKSLTTLGLPFIEKDDDGRRGIILKNVTLTEQDKSIFLYHPELIPSLYKKEDLLPVRECRVIFLGDGASGKSYTIKRFRNKGKKETKEAPYTTSETPGVEILDYHAELEGESFDVHFWDFGGQQLLHSMHRCFLSEDCCYVVTVKTRETKANERSRYWLRNVSAFAPNSPILLFVNCWEDDNGRRAIDEPGLREEFPKIQNVVYCSAKRAEDAEFKEKLMDPILGMSAASPGCTKQVPKQWIAVRNAIESESEANNYLTKARYHKLCEENEIKNEQAPELLSFFNSLGVCFSYHQDRYKQELDEYKLLSPVWLTNALYAIIEEGMAPAQDGRITERFLQNLLCNPAPVELDGKPHRRTAPEILYRKDECPWLLAVAEAHDLCYRVDDRTLFFPALCGTDTPKAALSTPEGYPQHVSYLLRYAYLPDSVLHQLMIRCMRNRLSVECCWLRGMVLYIGKLHKIFIRMSDEESLRIDIYSADVQPAYELFWMLRKEICEVNWKLNLQAEEYILDGKAEFLLEDVLAAAHDNALLYGRGIKYNARKLLGAFYELSVVQFMSIEDGKLIIKIPPREYHTCSKDNQTLRKALYDAYNGICPYCGQAISNIRDMQVDHILATEYQERAELQNYLNYLKSCGFDLDKPNYIENYFPVHGYCNRDKNNRVNEFTLPYWHDIAAQHALRVMRLMEQYKHSSKFPYDEKPINE